MVNDVDVSGKIRNKEELKNITNELKDHATYWDIPVITAQYFSKVDPNACLDQFVEYVKLRKSMEKKKMSKKKNYEKINKNILKYLDKCYLEKILKDAKFRENAERAINEAHSLESNGKVNMPDIDNIINQLTYNRIDFPLRYVKCMMSKEPNPNALKEYPNNYISNYDKWLYHVRKLNVKRIGSSVDLVTTNILYFIGSRTTGSLCNQEAFVYYYNQFERMLTNLYLYLNSGVLNLVCPEKYKDLLSYMATLGLFTTRRNDFIKYSRYIPEIVGVFSRNMKDLTSIVYTKGKGYVESKPYDNDESDDDQYAVPYDLMYDHLIIYSVGFNESLVSSLLNGNSFSNDQMEIINHIENILVGINKICPIREICDTMRIKYDILSNDLVHPKVKKRYSSKAVLQEGNLINK